MKILKYSDSIKKKFKCKTNTEPYLHFIITDKAWAIYIWDTRRIIETNSCDAKAYKQVLNMRIPDNHEPLVGKNSDLFIFSERSNSLSGSYIGVVFKRNMKISYVTTDDDKSIVKSEVLEFAKRNDQVNAKSWVVAPYVAKNISQHDYAMLLGHTDLNRIKEMKPDDAKKYIDSNIDKLMKELENLKHN
jgi:hypothetical protein